MCGGGICCLYSLMRTNTQICVIATGQEFSEGQILVKLLPLQIIIKLANQLLFPVFINSSVQRRQ